MNVQQNGGTTTGMATIQTPIVEEAQPTLLQAAGVKVENITLDNANADKRWANYGITEAPVMFVGTDGQAYPSGRYKAVTRNGKVAAIVGKAYTPIPNEHVKELLVEAGFDWEQNKEHNTRHGNGVAIELISKEFEYQIEPGDAVRAAVWVENSIDGGGSLRISMGVDRNRCWNGTIVRGAALGSIAMRHYGEPEKITGFLRDNIGRLFDQTQEIVTSMQQSLKVKFTKRHAEMIAKMDIAQKYTEDLFLMKDGKVDMQVQEDSMNLWNAYNIITGGTDDNSGIQHSNMSITGKLNNINKLANFLMKEAKAVAV